MSFFVGIQSEIMMILFSSLQQDIEEETLRKHFESCGPVQSVRLIRDKKTNLGKGFGYVKFEVYVDVAISIQIENLIDSFHTMKEHRF
jgi:nucleolar protein 12